MIVTGIVVEYNPFHNGHLYHIEQARALTQCDVLIAVMSGHYVQRGEPALVDKWERTKAALVHGVDLIIELPFPFVNQNASVFTKTAVELLHLAGCDYMVFGSESNNLQELQDFADLNINVDHLRENMKTGISYPKAYGLLSRSFYPNDILAIGYLRALKNTDIKPISIQRTNDYHNQNLEGTIASASAIRNALKNKEMVQHTTPMKLKNNLQTMENIFPYLRTLLLTMSSKDLKEIALFAEGIENHLIKCAQKTTDYDSFMAMAVSRRYTKSRIQRTLIAMLHQLKQTELDALTPPYFLKVLGFNERGQSYLRTLIEDDIYVVTKFNRIPETYAELELKTCASYTLNQSLDYQNYLYKREFQGPIIRRGDKFVKE